MGKYVTQHAIYHTLSHSITPRLFLTQMRNLRFIWKSVIEQKGVECFNLFACSNRDLMFEVHRRLNIGQVVLPVRVQRVKFETTGVKINKNIPSRVPFFKQHESLIMSHYTSAYICLFFVCSPKKAGPMSNEQK